MSEVILVIYFAINIYLFAESLFRLIHERFYADYGYTEYVRKYFILKSLNLLPMTLLFGCLIWTIRLIVKKI